ncbi:MAG: pectate lyase [Pirellulales bacterium]
MAYGIYRDEKYKRAIALLGDFLIAAQMPDPQPAWCQQYNYELVPIWARKFEPPAVSGWESQDVLETLLDVYGLTQDAKYLKPIPSALAYLKKSQLADGRMVRYYELETNKPLYMNRNGEQYYLTYDDTNLPDHYGWKQESRLLKIEERYKDVLNPCAHCRCRIRAQERRRTLGRRPPCDRFARRRRPLADDLQRRATCRSAEVQAGRTVSFQRTLRQ